MAAGFFGLMELVGVFLAKPTAVAPTPFSPVTHYTLESNRAIEIPERSRTIIKRQDTRDWSVK